VQANPIERLRLIRVEDNARNIFEDEEDLEDVTMNMTKYRMKHKEYIILLQDIIKKNV
jgi:hypothetical protein